MPSKEIEQPYSPEWQLLQDQSGQLLIHDAQIVFRNFAGREGQYNREGDRNFCVIIPPEVAEQMLEDRWNVKQLKPREEGVPGDYYIQVSVGFKNRPPNLWLISSKGRVRVSQAECELLDWVDIARAEVLVNPYNWKIRAGTPDEKTGVKAYVKTLVITLNEDYLELKYADVPELETSETLELEAGSGQDAKVVGHTDDGEEIYEGELVD